MNTLNEARILSKRNLLVVLSPAEGQDLIDDFFGSVVTAGQFPLAASAVKGSTVYLCGDISRAAEIGTDLGLASRVFVVRQLSQNFEEQADWRVVDVGRVPITVHGVGVYYRRFFETDINYFDQICGEHAFQSLTESNKPGTAHRTGIYLSSVSQSGDDLHFQLLRCSTNLSGPTDNFRANDRSIVDGLNQEAGFIFENHAPLNHVLAQLYPNTAAVGEQKQKKAKISQHADKTKDMPTNGAMAFCTFYDKLDQLQPLDAFDYGYKSTSGLTRLSFRLKATATERGDCDLPDQFTVTLYPNSVFFMPLSTNRLYTHEIRPSALDAGKLPTRLGYVVRCSDTEAVHTDGQTFIQLPDELAKLQEPTPEGVDELRKLYAQENKTDEFIDYGHRFLFSMNKGDYAAPEYRMTDEFRVYDVNVEDDIYAELYASVRFGDPVKGRQGAVLVNPDESRGVPIVRTTSRYNEPAQCFQPIHQRLARKIQDRASLPHSFNNALIENYTNAYAKMGAHSDQAIDLAQESYIAVFSCYQHPDLATTPRTLVVESKESGHSFEITLRPRSVVVFSVDTNRRFKHKIVLDKSSNPPDNQWLGMTFRTSGTFVQFRDSDPLLESGEALTLANETQANEFFQYRSQENRETDFVYPPLTYTISQSDLVPPEPPS